MIYKDCWVWYIPSNAKAHAAKIAESMGPAQGGVARRVLIKACGDGGRVWAQWSQERLQPYLDVGLEVVPWSFPEPENDAEVQAMVQTLQKYPANEFVLNPEVPWGGYSAQYVDRWVKTAHEKIQAVCQGIEIGFSSVASWDWFPYSAFSSACDGTEQTQCYWKQWVADQVQPMRRKSRVGAKIVVGLPACQTEDSGGVNQVWGDQDLMDLADYYAMGTRDLVGMNGWQSGGTGPGTLARADFGYRPMAYAYDLLKQFQTPVITQPAGLALPYNIRPEGDVWHCYVPDGSLDTWVVEPKFIEFYLGQGSKALELFGLPIAGAAPDRDGRYTQYFERARFELDHGRVVLGLVGAEAMAHGNEVRKFEVVGTGQLSAMGVAA